VASCELLLMLPMGLISAGEDLGGAVVITVEGGMGLL
jgi:hypothetical protein